MAHKDRMTSRERILAAMKGQPVDRIKPYSGVLLGSADTAPRGTPPENFKLIRELVETVGAYA